MDVWGDFNVRGKKEADTIPVTEKKVAHVKVLSERLCVAGAQPGETGKLKGPNKRLEVPQVANPFR